MLFGLYLASRMSLPKDLEVGGSEGYLLPQSDTKPSLFERFPKEDRVLDSTWSHGEQQKNMLF